MIVGTGIDIAEVPRIAESIARFGDRFLRRIYTESEIRYCDSKANRVEALCRAFRGQRSGYESARNRMEPWRPLA